MPARLARRHYRGMEGNPTNMLGIFTAPLHFGLVVRTQSSRFKHCAVSKVFAEDSSLVGRSGTPEKSKNQEREENVGNIRTIERDDDVELTARPDCSI